jgi:3-oxoadipate enol-lactonase
VRDFDYRERLREIRMPTLVISGTHDPAATAADGRWAAQQIPGAKYVELDAAHLSNIEARERFTAEISNFLAA